MLNAIKKKFFNAAKEEVEMAETKGQTELSVVPNTAELSALVAQMASQSETLLAVQAQFAELTTKYEAATVTLAAVEASKQALVVSAAETKASARKAKVEAAIGTVKAPALLVATESLDDVSFEAIVASLATSLDDEAKSKMFVEAGVSTEASTVADEKPIHFNKFIKSNKEAK